MKKCAFNNEHSCSALKVKQCEGCHFFKTSEELTEGRKKAKERVSKLPTKTQTYIRNKYYYQGRSYTK